MECELIKQGFEQGSCQVFDFKEGRWRKACESTLRYKAGIPYRLINAIFLSRPEHYLSIYQFPLESEEKETIEKLVGKNRVAKKHSLLYTLI